MPERMHSFDSLLFFPTSGSASGQADGSCPIVGVGAVVDLAAWIMCR